MQARSAGHGVCAFEVFHIVIVAMCDTAVGMIDVLHLASAASITPLPNPAMVH